MQIEEEIWKPVIGFEGVYEVSSFGRVKSLRRLVSTHNGGVFFRNEKILDQNIDFYGYKRIGVWVNGKTKTLKVHQLVAIAFLNHIPCGHYLVVNHKDFDRTNNNVSNLEIITNRANSNHRQKKGTSIYPGVYWYKRTGKWMSRIRIKDKTKFLGYFLDEKEAGDAYQKELLKILKNDK